MAISSIIVEKLATLAWMYTWAGTAPFDVWLSGEKVRNQTSDTTIIVEGADSEEPPAIEVRDANDTGLAESQEYSPLLTFQWRGNTDSIRYLVQESVSSVWTTRKPIRESGLGYYRDTTLALADATAANWRVIAEDESGNQSQPLLIEVFIVRNPSPPSIDITYSSGTGLATVAAR